MPTDLQEYVNQKIASGQFASPEEFATEAIRVYRQIETDYESFKRDVQQRITEADSGKLKPLDIDVFKSKLIGELASNDSPKR